MAPGDQQFWAATHVNIFYGEGDLELGPSQAAMSDAQVQKSRQEFANFKFPCWPGTNIPKGYLDQRDVAMRFPAICSGGGDHLRDKCQNQTLTTRELWAQRWAGIRQPKLIAWPASGAWRNMEFTDKCVVCDDWVKYFDVGQFGTINAIPVGGSRHHSGSGRPSTLRIGFFECIPIEKWHDSAWWASEDRKIHEKRYQDLLRDCHEEPVEIIDSNLETWHQWLVNTYPYRWGLSLSQLLWPPSIACLTSPPHGQCWMEVPAGTSLP